MPELGLNIDHVATLREARYRGWKRGLAPEPDLLQAARIAEEAGVDQITVHLREDRRHIQDADVRELGRALKVPLNLEMAATAGDDGARRSVSSRRKSALCRRTGWKSRPRAGSM